MATTLTRNPTETVDSTDISTQPTTAPNSKTTWTIFVGLAGLIAATGVVVAQVVSTPVIDGSFDTNEAHRMAALSTLAPVSDGSFEANEAARFSVLAPQTDSSFDINEFSRMVALSASSDTSFDDNEVARMNRLAPASDTSFQDNEDSRLQGLSDGR